MPLNQKNSDDYVNLSRLPIDVADAYRAAIKRAAEEDEVLSTIINLMCEASQQAGYWKGRCEGAELRMAEAEERYEKMMKRHGA